MIDYTLNEAQTFMTLIFDGNHNDPEHNGVYVNHDELLRFGDIIFTNEYSKKILELYELPCQDNTTSHDPQCECIDIAEEVISGYIWECNIRNYTLADHWKDKKSLYVTQFDLGYPENQYPWDSNDCHSKACHCVSKHWFFSEFERNTILSADEKKVAKNYRDLVGNFIRNGHPNQPNESKFLPFQKSHEIIQIQLCLHQKAHRLR